MEELMKIGFAWIHLLAAVVWIGGILFILRVAIPAARESLGSEAPKLMGAVSSRFTPFANASILLLLLSGIALLVLKSLSGMSGAPGIGLIAKILLFLVMAGVHFYRGRILAPQIAGAGSEKEKAGLQKLSLNLVWFNLAAGLFVLLLSAG